MTEKIIIDGVNVAGCVYYKGKCMEYTHYCQIGCKECTDIGIKLCHYKQTERFKAKIDRLEQENKDLKKQIESYKSLITVGGKQQYEYLQKIDKLEQENKELKDKITALEDKLQLRMASDKESDAFWDEIFSEKDYPFNKENAYKELKDYYFVLEQLPKIYMEITGGTLSKTTYFASSVIEAYNDALSRYYDEIDDLEYNNAQYKTTLEEIRNITKDAYENDNEYQATGVYTEITDKINEVLNVK